jgi:hypothetical protein
MMFKYYKNDKEFEQDKAIEEMTDYLFGNAISHDTQFKGDCRSIAIDLICAGYRKIRENEVVLTRKEYDEYKKCKDLLKQYINGELVNEDIFAQQVEELKKVREDSVDRFAEMLFDFLDDYALFDKRFLERKINEIRKEIKKNPKGEK